MQDTNQGWCIVQGFASHCLDRMTYGATKADIAAFNSLGGMWEKQHANGIDRSTPARECERYTVFRRQIWCGIGAPR